MGMWIGKKGECVSCRTLWVLSEYGRGTVEGVCDKKYWAISGRAMWQAPGSWQWEAVVTSFDGPCNWMECSDIDIRHPLLGLFASSHDAYGFSLFFATVFASTAPFLHFARIAYAISLDAMVWNSWKDGAFSKQRSTLRSALEIYRGIYSRFPRYTSSLIYGRFSFKLLHSHEVKIAFVIFFP